jgi:hypothetical protein
VHYDAYPAVRYRQHAHNVIGAYELGCSHAPPLSAAKRGRLRYWEDLNVAALARLLPRMNEANRRIFELFRKARHEPLLRRVTIFAQTGVYRQTTLSNSVLLPAMVLNKI